MKKYIYSPHHQGLVEAPKNSWWLKDTPEINAYMEECKFLYDNPEKHTMPTHRLQAKEWEAYNTWLSSPPIYKVRPEDIKYFLEPIDESQFEVVEIEDYIGGSGHTGYPTFTKFAIPKKGNESKEQSPSVEPDFENDPYWVGQAYLQDKQLLEIEKMFDDNGLRLELTCSACPEQYDVFLKVGYLRLRHGEFRVDYPDCGGKTIYEAEPNGDGIFNKDERVKYMEEAMKAILKMLNKDKNVKVSDTTGDASSKNAD
jgi:hypothetical protein